MGNSDSLPSLSEIDRLPCQVYFNTDKAEDRLTANPEEFINVMFRPGAPNTGEGLSKITPEDGVMALAGPDLPPTTLLTPDEIKTYANFYRSIGGLNGPLQWYRMGEASFPEFVNVPKEINVKTLFVGAEYDPFSSPAFTAPMTHFIKDLKMKEVKGAGHWVAYEKYAELNAAIEDWLERGI